MEALNNPLIKTIDRLDQFESLRDEWNRIVESNGRFSVFSTWEWSHCWWRHYAEDGCRLHILVYEDSGEIRAIAPFYIRDEQGCLGRRSAAIFLLGTGPNHWEEVTSIYLDMIADDAIAEAFAIALAGYLNTGPRWHRLELIDVLPESLILVHLAPRLRQGHYANATPEISFSFPIRLPPTFEKYLSSLSRNRRKAIFQNRRRLENRGTLTQRFLENIEDIDDNLRELVRLHLCKHGANYSDKSAFESEKFIAFHRDLLKLMLPRGWIDLRFLALDGNDIGTLYNFRFNGDIYSYQSGFAYDKWSPGLLTDMLAIEEACGVGQQSYDLLKGHPDSFKTSIGADQVELHSLVIYAHPARACFAALVARIKNRLRSIKNCCGR